MQQSESDLEQENKQQNEKQIDVQQILQKFKNPTAEKTDDLAYDLFNLTAFDIHTVDATKIKEENSDEHLKEISRDNVQLLFNRLFTLPLEPRQDEPGLFAQLPTPTLLIPREKHLPGPKPLTRWEKYAREKGISKTKRGRMVWDDNYNEWRPRYGFKRANDPNDEWISEAKTGVDDYNGAIDPFERVANEKKERVERQGKKESRNRKMTQNSQSQLNLPGVMSIHNPKSFTSKMLGTDASGRKFHDKSHLSKAFHIASQTTASKGNFDAPLDSSLKTPKKTNQKRQFDAITSTNEKQKSMSVINKVLSKYDGTINTNKAANQYINKQNMKSSKEKVDDLREKMKSKKGKNKILSKARGLPSGRGAKRPRN
eukprot:TRINITY_DN70_c5_g1_i1.p1 TRINITY_DN70_c5_g1~~TRINITY_DN70_c5_g1_i1.p1  ORF type:complete len:396 (-),score=168.08 TRINITY_DN70_c5_g1_i1:156-1268(-)